MKKIVVVLFLSVSFMNYAQTGEPMNEAKLNVFNLIAYKWLDVTYERVLNEESSIGVAIQTRLDNKDSFEYNRTFSLTPYYRYFFMEDNAEGLFGEAFAIINSGNHEVKTTVGETTVNEYLKYSDFGFGLGLGYKYVSTKNFVAELHAGAARNLLGKENAPNIVSRFGVSLGYRF